MRLHGYFRSSAAYRVRIALNLKGVKAEHVFRHLRKGEQRAPDYLAMNPDFSKKMTDLKKSTLLEIAVGLHRFVLPISGSEGYAKAEVTVGGVDTDALSSKTMASKAIPSLYFVGEAVDVTGWLGGYNFQWAWASGKACGEVV